MTGVKYLSDYEVNELLTKSVSNVFHYTIFITMLNSGLRVSEVCSIRPMDINFHERYIHVKGKGKIEYKCLKCKLKYDHKTYKKYNAICPKCENTINKKNLHKIRSIDINTQVSQQLKLYIELKKITSKERIFPITRVRVYQILKNYNPRFHPHMLRHTYAIKNLRTIGNIRYLQKQLGHAKMDTTSIYLQYKDYDKEKEKLEGMYE